MGLNFFPFVLLLCFASAQELVQNVLDLLVQSTLDLLKLQLQLSAPKAAAGLCLCYQVPTGVKLSSALLKTMAGRKLDLADLQECDHQLANSMQAVLAASATTLFEVYLTFEAEDDEPKLTPEEQYAAQSKPSLQHTSTSHSVSHRHHLIAARLKNAVGHFFMR